MTPMSPFARSRTATFPCSISRGGRGARRAAGPATPPWRPTPRRCSRCGCAATAWTPRAPIRRCAGACGNPRLRRRRPPGCEADRAAVFKPWLQHAPATLAGDRRRGRARRRGRVRAEAWLGEGSGKVEKGGGAGPVPELWRIGEGAAGGGDSGDAFPVAVPLLRRVAPADRVDTTTAGRGAEALVEALIMRVVSYSSRPGLVQVHVWDVNQFTVRPARALSAHPDRAARRCTTQAGAPAAARALRRNPPVTPGCSWTATRRFGRWPPPPERGPSPGSWPYSSANGRRCGRRTTASCSGWPAAASHAGSSSSPRRADDGERAGRDRPVADDGGGPVDDRPIRRGHPRSDRLSREDEGLHQHQQTARAAAGTGRPFADLLPRGERGARSPPPGSRRRSGS